MDTEVVAPILTPTVAYSDAAQAIRWLTGVLRFSAVATCSREWRKSDLGDRAKTSGKMKMRSLRGFLAAIICLSALPIALLYQILSGAGFEAVFHLLFALGLVVISFSVFDFKLPSWITWIGCLSASALAAIFLLQGLSELIQNDSLTHFAYQVLGQWVEKGLLDLLVFWFVALLLVDSQGKTWTFGFVAMSIVVCLEVYTYSLSYLGRAPAQILKLAYLLMFVWFLLESTKKEMSPPDPSGSGFESKESGF